LKPEQEAERRARKNCRISEKESHGEMRDILFRRGKSTTLRVLRFRLFVLLIRAL
jgi:hypothetical protein